MPDQRRCNPPTDRNDRCVYVLGTGRSLLDLTDRERAWLRRQTTIAMNKYMLFWDALDIFPTHYFLADLHDPAPRVLAETRAIVRRCGNPMHYLLDTGYEPTVCGDDAVEHHVNGNSGEHTNSRAHEQVTFFHRPHCWAPLDGGAFPWARSLDEPMFFHRGSLSVLLNLIAVLQLGTRIKILGVDLNTSAYFFDDALRRRTDLHDDWYRATGTNPERSHATAVPHKGMPGIQASFPFIMEQLDEAGIECTCCNPHSLLVEQGLCPYGPVIDAEPGDPRASGTIAVTARTPSMRSLRQQAPLRQPPRHARRNRP